MRRDRRRRRHGAGAELFQAKGFPYRLEDLLIDPALVETYRDGTYVTLRLTSSMYHRFHAPHDATIERVTYVSGRHLDVNPIALKRVERLFCRNERAVLRLRLASGGIRWRWCRWRRSWSPASGCTSSTS